MNDKTISLIKVFRDTQSFCEENPILRKAVNNGIRNAVFYSEQDYPRLPEKDSGSGVNIVINKNRSFEAALLFHQTYPDKKIAVLNFASATNPGGGVKTGASAQEECLCRCSTLYPILNQPRLWDVYYKVNRNKRDPLHTDACIYSPGVIICKTDEMIPRRLREEDFVSVDVISCAAPNLRGRTGSISADALYQLHLSRAKHILHIAAINHVNILVLGAFGCGAFGNAPEIVADAYYDALKDYERFFDEVVFAVYCGNRDSKNYDAFERKFSDYGLIEK